LKGKIVNIVWNNLINGGFSIAVFDYQRVKEENISKNAKSETKSNKT
jgi:hypothetical protein